MSAPEEPKPVLCVGDMVVDIFASPLARLPDPGESFVTEEISFFPGGNALNTAVALRRLGDRVAMAGSTGDDALGTLLLEQLRALELDVREVHREAGVTPSTLILLTEGEDRRFISALGVGDRFTGQHVSPDLIPDNGILVVGGYLKLHAWNDEALIELLRHARQRNCRVVLNVCVVQNSPADPNRCLPLLEHVDIFIPNEDEARAVTGESVLAQQARILREAGARLVVITRGNQGLYAEDSEQAITMGAFQVPVVDPSGCGDCFTAGLVAALSRRRDTVSMLKCGSALGALAVTALGCTNAVPSFAEMERFLTNNSVQISVRPTR